MSNYSSPYHNQQWFLSLLLPFIKCTVLGVSLQRALLYDEPHLLEEGCGGSWRLSLQEDVDWLGNSVAQLVTLTVSALTALGVLAVSEPVLNMIRHLILGEEE